MSETLPEALTPKEAADFLRISTRTLRRKVAMGNIPAPYKSGRIVLFSRDALRELLRPAIA